MRERPNLIIICWHPGVQNGFDLASGITRDIGQHRVLALNLTVGIYVTCEIDIRHASLLKVASCSSPIFSPALELCTIGEISALNVISLPTHAQIIMVRLGMCIIHIGSRNLPFPGAFFRTRSRRRWAPPCLLQNQRHISWTNLDSPSADEYQQTWRVRAFTRASVHNAWTKAASQETVNAFFIFLCVFKTVCMCTSYF